MTEWQPIETAPRDGTEFLAIGSLRAIVVVAFERDPSNQRQRVLVETFRKEVLHGPAAWATHWMPLPTPPEEAP